MFSGRSILDYLTNDYNDEYIVEIDENGRITKIPYSPFLECMAEDDYKKLVKEVKENQLNKEIENFKKKFIKNMPNLIEVEEMKDAEIILTIRKDKSYFNWDVEKNDNPDLEMVEIEKKLFGIIFYWFRRKDQQNSIDNILDYVYKTLKKELC